MTLPLIIGPEHTRRRFQFPHRIQRRIPLPRRPPSDRSPDTLSIAHPRKRLPPSLSATPSPHSPATSPLPPATQTTTPVRQILPRHMKARHAIILRYGPIFHRTPKNRPDSTSAPDTTTTQQPLASPPRRPAIAASLPTPRTPASPIFPSADSAHRPPAPRSPQASRKFLPRRRPVLPK